MKDIIDFQHIRRARYFYVYCLIDPRVNEVRYVGRTSNLKGRLKGHITSAQKVSHTLKGKWIEELSNLELEPDMKVLCVCGTHSENLFMEQFFIKWFTALIGEKLTNGYSLKDETPGIDEFIKPGASIWEAYEKSLYWFYNQQKELIDDMVLYLKELNIPTDGS